MKKQTGKCESAVALGKMKLGVKEKKSELKSKTCLKNIRLALKKRWPKNKSK